MFIYLKAKQRRSYVHKMFPTAHIKPVDNPQKAAEYCQKKDSRVEDPIVWGVMPGKQVRDTRQVKETAKELAYRL